MQEEKVPYYKTLQRPHLSQYWCSSLKLPLPITIGKCHFSSNNSNSMLSRLGNHRKRIRLNCSNNSTHSRKCFKEKDDLPQPIRVATVPYRTIVLLWINSHPELSQFRSRRQPTSHHPNSSSINSLLRQLRGHKSHRLRMQEWLKNKWFHLQVPLQFRKWCRIISSQGLKVALCPSIITIGRTLTWWNNRY